MAAEAGEEAYYAQESLQPWWPNLMLFPPRCLLICVQRHNPGYTGASAAPTNRQPRGRKNPKIKVRSRFEDGLGPSVGTLLA